MSLLSVTGKPKITFFLFLSLHTENLKFLHKQNSSRMNNTLDASIKSVVIKLFCSFPHEFCIVPFTRFPACKWYRSRPRYYRWIDEFILFTTFFRLSKLFGLPANNLIFLASFSLSIKWIYQFNLKEQTNHNEDIFLYLFVTLSSKAEDSMFVIFDKRRSTILKLIAKIHISWVINQWSIFERMFKNPDKLLVQVLFPTSIFALIHYSKGSLGIDRDEARSSLNNRRILIR